MRNWLVDAAGALKGVAIAAALAGGVLGATAASAAVSTWDFRSGNLLPNVIPQGSAFVANDGKVLTAASGLISGGSADLTQSLFGLGVCSGLPDQCAQVDTVEGFLYDLFGAAQDEYIILALPTDRWQAVSIVVDLVTPILNGTDTIQVFGTNDFVGFESLLAGGIAALGTNIGGFAYEIEFGPVDPFQYYVFTTNNPTGPDNDGYSLAGFVGQVPEPASIALLGAGLLGIGVIGRRRRKAS